MKYVLRADRSRLHLYAIMQTRSTFSQYGTSNLHRVLRSFKPYEVSNLVQLPAHAQYSELKRHPSSITINIIASLPNHQVQSKCNTNTTDRRSFYLLTR
jgi:hypothetical protein